MSRLWIIFACVLRVFAAPFPIIEPDLFDQRLEFPLTLQWVVEFENERFITEATPKVMPDGVAVVGERFQALLSYKTGKLLTEKYDRLPFEQFGNRSAQTAALEGRAVYKVDERLHLARDDWQVPPARDAGFSRRIWTSHQMTGQIAGKPTIVHNGGKTFVVVRTNPILNMAEQISKDRNFLTAQAGIDAGDWKKLDAWIKSPAALGTPELIAKEQDAIVRYLETNRWAETFFAFDAETGKRAFTAPILWTGGCQGVGAPPAITRDGKAVVEYRSAYGNWNHGVAPLVALGLLNFQTGRIEPLRHKQGMQPPWNTFWGTADEAQTFVIAHDDLIIVHQGTLSRFNLVTHDLEKIWGERDTFGGFKNPPWARNEWHGPGRGRVAISNGRIFWITGSRILCLGPGKPDKKPEIQTIKADRVNGEFQRAEDPDLNIEQIVHEALEKSWAPLFVQPGLAGREFFFEELSELFTAYAWAYPHLGKEGQKKLKSFLDSQWKAHAPFSTNALLSLNDGGRREEFSIPPQELSRLANDKPAHRFGGVYSAWLYAERCGAWTDVTNAWPEIQVAFDDFQQKNSNFGNAPELYFNRYLASILAYEQISKRVGQPSTKAHELSERAFVTLLTWWKEAGSTLTTFNGSSELDRFIGKGDKLSFAVFPHRHKIALFHDLAPEIAATVRERAPDAAEKVWSTFEYLCPTWFVVGGERQYHFGENFIDPPDLALDGFAAAAWIHKSNSAELKRFVDRPFCKADLYYLQKLAIAKEAARP